MSEPVWPFTWCTVHFAGAVEEMAGCLVWRAKIEVANEFGEADGVLVFEDPDCVLVQRLLVDREAMDQIGWFNPGSKRFCYTDEKEFSPQHNASYTKPVFVATAIGDTDE